MSEVITFDTEKAAAVKPVAPSIPTVDLVPPDHPILYEVMPEFDFANPPAPPSEIASVLVETCKKNNGLGLSANQCGFKYRVFVMGVDDNFVAYFNPKIISQEEETHMEEGCLSFPLLMLRITRPKTITVEYQDYLGEKHTVTFSGITARCFLHELDHMNGIVYTSRVKPLALKFGLKKLEKIRRKYFNPKALAKMQAQAHGK
jgi:peptide deformylase